jgi:hypothetical protein
VGTLGARYKMNVNEKYTALFDAQGYYSSSYFPSAEENPLAEQGGYGTVDLAMHIARSNNEWDLALICRDCANKYYIVFGNDAGTTLQGVPVGTNVLINRPRQIMLQLTVHPQL